MSPSLVCLDPDPPNHLFPFTPDYLVNQAAAKGATYGPDIQAQRYSDTIKHMILECLYEKPAHRCKLQDMKYTINYAIDKIIDESGPDGDDWADLELPEPGGPVIYPRSILPPTPAAPPAPAPPVLAPPLAPAVPAPAPFPVPGQCISPLLLISFGTRNFQTGDRIYFRLSCFRVS